MRSSAIVDVVAKRRPFSLAIACALAGLAACGEALGGDDDATPPPRPGADGGDGTAPNGDGRGDGPNDGAVDGGDGASCSANGTLDLDPTFAPTLTLEQGKTALASNDVLGTVGKCRDGGVGLELGRMFLDGGVLPAATCFGSTSPEAPQSIAPTSQGWAIASVRNSGVTFARAIHVTSEGAKLADDEISAIANYQHSYARFAVEVGSSIVWGGYRYSSTGSPERGFLKVIGSFVVNELAADELPMVAAVSGDRLYVGFVRAAAGGGAKELAVKRYDVVNGNIVVDATFSTGTPPTVTGGVFNFDPMGSMLVENGVVTVAAGQGGGTPIFTLTNGTWTQETTSAIVVARIARSCDGSLVVGSTFTLDGSSQQGLVRRAGGANAGDLALASGEIAALLRHPSGDLYVAQSPGSPTTVRRVRP